MLLGTSLVLEQDRAPQRLAGSTHTAHVGVLSTATPPRPCRPLLHHQCHPPQSPKAGKSHTCTDLCPQEAGTSKGLSSSQRHPHQHSPQSVQAPLHAICLHPPHGCSPPSCSAPPVQHRPSGCSPRAQRCSPRSPRPAAQSLPSASSPRSQPELPFQHHPSCCVLHVRARLRARRHPCGCSARSQPGLRLSGSKEGEVQEGAGRIPASAGRPRHGDLTFDLLSPQFADGGADQLALLVLAGRPQLQRGRARGEARRGLGGTQLPRATPPSGTHQLCQLLHIGDGLEFPGQRGEGLLLLLLQLLGPAPEPGVRAAREQSPA